MNHYKKVFLFFYFFVGVLLFSTAAKAQQTVTITGTISYQGNTSTGTFYIWASTQGPFGEPAIGPEPGPFGNYWVVISSDVDGNNVSFNYELKVYAGLTYWIMAFRDHHPPFIYEQGENPMQDDPRGIYSSEGLLVDENKNNINITLTDPTPVISGSVVYDSRYGVKVGSRCVVFVATSTVLGNNELWNSIVATKELEITQQGSYNYKFYAEELGLQPPASYYVFAAYDAEAPFNWFSGGGPSVGDIMSFYNGKLDTTKTPFEWILEPTPIYLESSQQQVSNVNILLDTEVLGWQYGYITGKVTSTVDGSALSGTIITILKSETTRYVTTCDEQGEYSLIVVQDTYDVKASSSGYISQTKTGIQIPYQSTATVNFSLLKPLKISGVLSYNGLTENGTYYIWVSTQQQYGQPAVDVYNNLLLISTFVAGNTLSYEYSFENLEPNKSYWVMAFRDVNPPYLDLQQQQNPLVGDPQGAYEGNPIYLDSDKSDINITIQDPPPTGSIEGEISYTGDKRKELIVLLFDNPNMQGSPVSFVSLGTPQSYPQNYQIPGLTIGNTYYLVATMVSFWSGDSPVILEEDPWYIHGDTSTWPPQMYMIPVLSTEPVTLNFSLVDGNNPFATKQFEVYSFSSHQIDFSNSTEGIHNYFIYLELRDNFSTALKVELKGPGFADGNTFVEISSTPNNGGVLWSTYTVWNSPPDELPALPLNYIIKVTTSTEGEGLLEYNISITTFIPTIELLAPQPFTNLKTQPQSFTWTSAGENKTYIVRLIDRGTNNQGNEKIWEQETDQTSISYTGENLQDGHYYQLEIQARDQNWNYSYNRFVFSYNSAATMLLITVPNEFYNPYNSQGKYGSVVDQNTENSFKINIYAVNNAWIIDEDFDNQITLQFNREGGVTIIQDNPNMTDGKLQNYEVHITTPGNYNIIAQFNQIQGAKSLLILDTSSPTPFNLTSPVNNLWQNYNWVNFQWEAAYDNSNAVGQQVRYELYLNNNLKEGNIHTNSYSCLLDEGSYEWYVVAVDVAGNKTKSNQTWIINIDTTPPAGLTVTQPDKSFISTNNVTFSWIPQENIQSLSKYVLRIYSYGDPVVEAELPAIQTSTTVFLNEGVYNFYMEVYDKANNSYSTVSWWITIDTTPPQGFSLSAPQNNSYNTTNVTFVWTFAYDTGSGIDKYQLYLNNELKEDNIQTNSIQVELDEGIYTWYVKAIDKAGNETNSQEMWTVIVDTTGPTVKITYPQNNSYLDTLSVISGTASDELSGVDKVELMIERLSDNKYWNGTSWVNYTNYFEVPFNNGVWSYAIPQSMELTNNTSYYIYASAVDKAGNYNDEDDVALFNYVEMGYIAGKVTSTIDGSAIVGTVVGVFEQDELKFATVCDDNGEYSIKVPVGSYNVGVSSYGYMPDLKENIVVVKNDTTTVNFTLDLAVGWISGEVKNSLGQPLVGSVVEIFVGGDKVGEVISDEEGKYSVLVSTLNVYKVKASSSGYSSEEQDSKVVLYRSTTTVSFELIDITSPTVFSLISPQDGIWKNTNEVEFNWSESYDYQTGLKKYMLYVDDEVKEDNIPPTQTSTTTFLSEGTYEWYVVAVDNEDNETQSQQTWRVKIDTTAPNNFNLTSPQNNSYSYGVVTFEWEDAVDDGSGIDRYQLYINDELKQDDIHTNSVEINLNEGEYNWYVKAFDKAGNSTQSETWKVTVDTTPPSEFSLLSPTNGQWCGENDISEITFRWSEAEDTTSGIDKYQLYIDNQLVVDDMPFTSKGVNLSNYAEGEHSWYVKAIDKAGNEKESSQTWTINIDTTPPVVSIIYPPDKSFIDSLEAIYGTAEDLGIHKSGVEGSGNISLVIKRLSDNKYWNGTGWQESSTAEFLNVSGNGIWSYDAATLSQNLDVNESYKLEVVARDNVNNWGELIFSTFTYIDMGYIAGKVTSTVDGSAISGAVVGVFEQGELKFTTVCDENGDYSIKVPVGIYEVVVSSYGYMPDLKTGIEVSKNSTTTVNFTLDLAVGWIAGEVKNSLEHPLVGSLVEIFAGANKVAQAVVDEEGKYSVLVATMSEYKVKVSSYGYGDKEEDNVVVEYKSTTTVSFELIDITSPTAFSLISPTNDVWINGYPVEFSWEPSNDNQTGLAKYVFYVGGDIKEDNIPPEQTYLTLFIPEGEHSWYVVAVDKEGNKTQSETWTVKIDTTPPSNVVLQQEPQYTKGTTNIISWQQATDNLSGIKEYIVFISSSETFDWYTEVTTNETSYEFTNLEDGVTYYYRVKAKDNAGNFSQQWSNVVWSVQDATPPSEFSLKSSSGIINTNEITFEWEASNDATSGLSRYQLWINEQLLYNDINPTKTSTTTFIPEGEYSWYIVAIDNAGNEKISKDIWTINIDTTPPTISITTPQDNSNINNLTVISGTASDIGLSPSGINNIKLTIKRLTDNYTWTGSSWSVNQHYVLVNFSSNVWSYTGLTNAALTIQTSYYIIATAKDNATNENTTSIKFTYVSYEPQKGTISGYVRSSYNNEPLKGAIVEVFKDTNIISTTTVGADGLYSVLIETGVYKVRASSLGYSVEEYDDIIVLAQQVSTANFILIDITSPTAFSLVSPLNNSVHNTNYIEFSWNSSEDKETGLLYYQLYINGQLAENGISPQKTSTTTFVSESENINWYVVAVDKVGNKTQTETWNITVDTTPPSLTLSYPQDGSIVDVKISSIVFVFSEEMNTTLNVKDALIITNYTLDNTTLTWVNNNTLLITLSTPLSFSTTYQITLNPPNNKLLKDKAGNELTTTYILFATKTEEIKFFSIRGYITTDQQTPIINTKVSIRKQTEQTPLFTKYTDQNGYYEFLNLQADETYIIEPYKINYTFTPSSITIYLNEDKNEINFLASFLVEEQKQIDIPLGLNDTLITIELPKVSDMKIITKENPEKPNRAKGTVNPDKSEYVGIVFNPAKNPQDYINKEFKIKIFTITGELVEEFTKIPQTPEDIFVKWTPKNLASGTYIVYVQGPNIKVYRKIVILR